MFREQVWQLGESWQESSTGLFVPPSTPRRKRPVAVDFFCGAGGFSLGLIAGGFDVIAGVEYDTSCMMTYLHNLGAYPVNIVYIEPDDRERAEKALRDEYRRDGWAGKNGDWTKGRNGLTNAYRMGPLLSGSNRHAVCSGMGRPDFNGVQHFFLGDVRKLTGQRILESLGMERGEIDLVVGGPPCQGYSRAGKRDVMDPRNSLVFEYMRLVVELNPKAMVMEEVPEILNMTTPDGFPVMEAVTRILADGGFGTVDGIRQMLAKTAGAGAVLRGTGYAKRDAYKNQPSAPPVDSPPQAMQQALL